MRKKVLFIILGIFLTVSVIEFLSYMTAASLGYSPSTKQDYYKDRLTKLLLDQNLPLGRWAWPDEIAMPFFGYGIDYRARSIAKNFNRDEDIRINNYKFRSDADYPYIKKKDEYTIGIFGGSFAFNWAIHENATGKFAKLMSEEIKELKNKHVVLLNMSQGASKEPQQFFTFAYFYDMFDAVIFLDGYNEFALRTRSDYPIEFPFYSPRLYPMSAEKEDERKELAAKAAFYRGSLIGLLKLQRSFPFLSYSNLFYLIDRTGINYLKARISELNVMSDDPENNEEIFGQQKVTYETYLEKAVWIWARYTKMANDLAHDQGVKMYSFLQPNQYTGQKNLTAKELDVAYFKSHEQQTQQAYAVLKKWQENLEKKYLVSADLMNAFKDSKEDLYIDICCHVNDRGNDILTEKLVQFLEKHWK
jgi:hypothetical protein